MTTEPRDISTFTVTPIRRLNADFAVPGDKSISHRSVMLAALAEGVSEIRGFLPSADCLCTLQAMRDCGVKCEVLEEQPGQGPLALRVEGRAMRLAAPTHALDCGNSGTTMRLLAGLLAGQPFSSELTGDASLSSRPMARVTIPLAEMGARIDAVGAKPGCAPLRISPAQLVARHHEMSVASAQVKSALLLAGMYCKGVTELVQPAQTRDHTERMLADFGVRLEIDGLRVALPGGQVPKATRFHVPGDISSAAYWIAAAAALPGSRLTIRGVGLNPSRLAILDVLERMGAAVTRTPSPANQHEPFGNIEIRGAALRGTELRRDEIPNLIDEIPVLAVIATQAAGVTSLRHAAELRVKETDRITATVANLRKMGAQVEEFDDGMEITGGHPLQGAELQSYGDHRIAMAFSIAGLFASGHSLIRGADCVAISYPGFHFHLDAICRGVSNPPAGNPPR